MPRAARARGGDDGRLNSDPTYPSSDLVLVSNDTLRIDLDNDADGEDAARQLAETFSWGRVIVPVIEALVGWRC